MPTQKRRLMVTVGDDLYELVQRLSELGGQSMSSIIVEMLEASRPVLEHLISTAEAYAAADASKQADMLAALEAAEARIMPRANELMEETLDAFDYGTHNEIGSTADPDDY